MTLQIKYIYVLFTALPPRVPVIKEDPCNPSPCGPNADCRVVGDSPSCSCRPNYIGSPPNCRPECVSNSECDRQKACIHQKCQDPCPGSCGLEALCRVVMHIPNCYCPPGHIGDPFSRCYPAPKPRKCWVICLVYTKF
jgi:hypothetical protein